MKPNLIALLAYSSSLSSIPSIVSSIFSPSGDAWTTSDDADACAESGDPDACAESDDPDATSDDPFSELSSFEELAVASFFSVCREEPNFSFQALLKSAADSWRWDIAYPVKK